MDLIINKDLRKRLSCAAENGSKVAQLIVDAISVENPQVENVMTCNGSNFFDSKKKVSRYDNGTKSVTIVITYCSRDVNNERFPEHDNPTAGYDQRNRTECNVVKFAKWFRAVIDKYNANEITYDDFEFFENVIRIGSKVNLEISDNPQSFYKAYNADFYASIRDNGDAPLFNSCMRYENTSKVCSDFYPHFAGCKILHATNDDGETLGRAVIWPNVMLEGHSQPVSLIERIYFAFDSVREMMLKFAIENGVQLRKTLNTYDSKKDFTALVDLSLDDEDTVTYPKDTRFTSVAYIMVPRVRWHREGAPYLDTFSWLYKPYNHNDYLFMANCTQSSFESERVFCVASMQHTGGTASRQGYVCPICGQKSSDSDGIKCLCSSCQSGIYQDTLFGYAPVCGFKQDPESGKYYPEKCFDEDGNLTKPAVIYKNIANLF